MVLLKRLLILTAAVLAAPAAQPAPADESQLKLAFLRNFIEFVRWPDDRANLLVCSFGSGDASQAVAALDGQHGHGGVLATRQVLRVDALRGCDVVYVPGPERAYLAGVLETTEGKPVLVVADIEGAAQLGAALSLHEAGGRIGFDANLSVARAAGLRLGSRLLQLARRVY